MALIAIDAGHGGFDNGAMYNGRKEKDDNLSLAFELGKQLEDRGFDVYYTRTDDVYDSPIEKARKGNSAEADLFVSLHRNAAYAPNTYSGVQTLVYDNSGVKKEIADAINSGMEELGFTSLGTEERKELAVLKRTVMPAILVESGFIDNDYDNMIYDRNLQAIATAIADGIATIYKPEEKRDVSAGFTLSESEKTEAVTAEAKNGMSNTEVSCEGEYYIQLGLFRIYRNAIMLAREVAGEDFEPVVKSDGRFYVVKLCGYHTMEEARTDENMLRNLGYDTLLVKEK